MLVLRPEAIRLNGLAVAALDHGRMAEADSLFRASGRAQPEFAAEFQVLSVGLLRGRQPFDRVEHGGPCADLTRHGLRETR